METILFVSQLPVFARKPSNSIVNAFYGKPLAQRRSASPRALSSPSAASIAACSDSTEFPPRPLASVDVTSADPPADMGAQLAHTLERMGEKFGNVTSQATTTVDDLRTEAEGKYLEPEQLLKAVTPKSDNIADSAKDDWWSAEQKALLSVVDDEIIGDDGAPVHVSSIADVVNAIASLSSEASSDAKNSVVIQDKSVLVSAEVSEPQADPRSLDARDVKRRLGRIKRRRKRLAVERGEDARHVLDAVSAPVVETTGPLPQVLRDLERENTKNIYQFSLSRSRIVHFETDAAATRSSALTSSAEHIMGEVMCCPLIYRPFFGMQKAFEILDNPPCPRCSRPTPLSEMAELGSVCRLCYKEIFLTHATAAPVSGVGEVWEEKDARAERKRQEARTADEAVAVTMNLLHEQAQKSHDISPRLEGAEMSASNGEEREAVAMTSNAVPGISGRGPASGHTGSNNDREPPVRGSARLGDGWKVQASLRSMRTINPIRNLIQNIDVKPNPDKELIKLSVGDPTVYGNLNVSKQAVNRFCDVMQSGAVNGYSMSMGSVEARTAVAKRYTTAQSPLTADDVILAGGTSGALELALGALANEGDNVLLPCPGFPLFSTISAGFGIECRYYNVNPDKNWEIELSDLIKLADSRTAAIVVNNPSNPCGSVYSATHIEDLLATASALKLPIISDEVYADMVFSGQEFVSIGTKSVDVPVLCVGGVSKQFVVPGWRLGWVLIHDRDGILEAGGLRVGLRQLTTRMLVPNTPAQAVLPTLLAGGTRDPAFMAVMEELETNARFTVKSLANAQGLRVIEPQGSMYVMAEIDVERLGLADDMEFTKKLIEEEAVFVLPGQCFKAPNFVRIVFAAPREVLSDAFFRIRSFCSRHSGGM